MFTKKEPVTGSVYIWAIPSSQWARENDPTTPPFRYELHTGNPWQNGAVRVSEHEVTLIVPPGVNLLAAAVETLEARKKEAMDTYARTVKELDDQIRGLLMLGGPMDGPGDDFIEGEQE